MREIGHVAWSGTRAKSPRVRNRPPDLENLGRRFGPEVGTLYPFFFLMRTPMAPLSSPNCNLNISRNNLNTTLKPNVHMVDQPCTRRSDFIRYRMRVGAQE